MFGDATLCLFSMHGFVVSVLHVAMSDPSVQIPSIPKENPGIHSRYIPTIRT